MSWRPVLSLRLRLVLFSVAVLTLFAVNVATHVWGSFARSESLVAYRDAVNAAQLITELQQSLENQRQQVLVLATLRETTDEPLGEKEQAAATDTLGGITAQLRRLGGLGSSGTADYYRRLFNSASKLIEEWRIFYRSYNERDMTVDVNSPRSYNDTQQKLKELDQRQAFLAIQRSNAIDETIKLTDRITVVGFIASIFITLILMIGLTRSTNQSLLRLKKGAQRFGAGHLTYRIDETKDAGEIKELAVSFNEMSRKLQRAIEEVRAAKADADQANATKSMFLANVSHELRTPLNAIIGYSEMLQDELSDTQDINRDQFGHDLGTIIFSGRQLLALINDILDLSKIETGKMQIVAEAFDPRSLIFQICDSLSPLVSQKNNKLVLDLAEDLPTMVSDASKFQQIVTNLFSNACKFTEDGEIAVSAWTDKDQLVLEVKDTGIGMTKAQQQRVFEAFVQAEASTGHQYGGTGLGLAISKEFCQLLGGDITLQSKVGKGATFTVSLPLVLGSDREVA
jgi:signal transduction histidine kinase